MSQIPDEILKRLVSEREVRWKDSKDSEYIIKIPYRIKIEEIKDEDITVEEIISLPIMIPSRLLKG